MVWHTVLYSICVGSLIAGTILVAILLVLSANSLAHSEMGETADHHVDSGPADSDSGIEGEAIDSDVDSEIDLHGHVEMSHDMHVEGSNGFDGHDDLAIHANVDDYDSFAAHGDIQDHSFESDHDGLGDHDGVSDHGHLDHHAEIHDHEYLDHHDSLSGHTNIDGDTEFDSHIATGIVEGPMINFAQNNILETSGKTPMSLIFSLYLTWFGATGTFFYDLIGIKGIWLGLILILPIGLTKLVSLVWQRIAKNSTYRVRLGSELLGRRATVKIDVSESGGLISVDNPDAVQQISARSLNPLAYFYPGDTVYICKYAHSEYFVDTNPDNIQLPVYISEKVAERNSSGLKLQRET